MHGQRHKSLLAVYSALLRLYPQNFRRQFGWEMREVFEQLVHERGAMVATLLILGELLGTLIREHLEDPSSIARLIRGLLCPIPALLIYAAAVARVERIEEFALSTFWFLCILAGFWRTGCRGRMCLLRTMGASVIGMLVPLALINSFQTMVPGFFSLAAPLALLAMTVGLVLAVLARLIMEGIRLRAAA